VTNPIREHIQDQLRKITMKGTEGQTPEFLRSEVERLTRELADAHAAIDANWVQHQRVVAAEARLQQMTKALEEIRDADPVELALDPDWPRRIARSALTALNTKKEGTGNG
jgi:ribosome-associated translation inhibitor RaiA